jgi:ferric-chelate reductase
VTCLCNPNDLLAIRNSTTEEAKPSIETLLAPMLENRSDAEKGALGSTTGGIAVAASGPESLICQARNAVAMVGPSAAVRVGGLQVHTELFAL